MLLASCVGQFEFAGIQSPTIMQLVYVSLAKLGVTAVNTCHSPGCDSPMGVLSLHIFPAASKELRVLTLRCLPLMLSLAL